jgi:5'-3' exonuclease
MYKILHWMHTEESTQKLLALSMIPGVGPATARRILNEFENLDEFFSQATRIRIPGVRPNDL